MTNELKNRILENKVLTKDERIEIINALEIVEEFEKAQIITGGRLNGRTYAYKCGLEDGKRKTLEQEPCEDCVSRADLLKIYENRFIELQRAHQKDKQLGVNWCINTLKGMPPVTPTCKVGHWVNKTSKSGCGISIIASECSHCKKKTFFNCDEFIYNYCPNCGAKMQESEE